ncbi:MAG: ATP-binding protein [bacterium]
MFDFFEKMTTEFMPHGGCFLWNPGILWTHVISDAVIGISYFSIPVGLAYFVRKRRDLAFSWMFVMFASFILFCGASHFMEIWTTWEPFYWTEGMVKVATAAVSAVTAIALWPLIPRALELPSPQQLKDEIKQRREAEQELREVNRTLEKKVQERTEELEQFIYAASHDLREPVRTMQTYAGFLEEDLGDVKGKVKEDIEFISDSADRMSELINSLLKLSRTSRQDLEPTDVSVEESVHEALQHLEASMEEKAVRIEWDDLPEVTADPALLSDLFKNLISNALKYGVDESGTIRITATQEKGQWTLGVKDDGPGVPSDKQEEIFQPFKHLHSWEDYEGTGIGLSICRRIVDQHGGDIWVESEPGEGAHFKFTLGDGGERT